MTVIFAQIIDDGVTENYINENKVVYMHWVYIYQGFYSCYFCQTGWHIYFYSLTLNWVMAYFSNRTKRTNN